MSAQNHETNPNGMQVPIESNANNSSGASTSSIGGAPLPSSSLLMQQQGIFNPTMHSVLNVTGINVNQQQSTGAMNNNLQNIAFPAGTVVANYGLSQQQSSQVQGQMRSSDVSSQQSLTQVNLQNSYTNNSVTAHNQLDIQPRPNPAQLHMQMQQQSLRNQLSRSGAIQVTLNPSASLQTSLNHDGNLNFGASSILMNAPSSAAEQIQNQPTPPPPMAASSIHVTTGSYIAPRPQNRAKKPTVPSSVQSSKSSKVSSSAASSSSARPIPSSTGVSVPASSEAAPAASTSSSKKESPVKLAAVPTRRLASRSIISLNLNPQLRADSLASTSTSAPSQSPTIQPGNSPASCIQSKPDADVQMKEPFFSNSPQNNHLQSQTSQIHVKTESQEPIVASSLRPTSEQIDNRKSSSYSSACNATILAQQELSTSNQNHSNNSAMAPLSETNSTGSGSPSSLKRASPDPEKDQSKHKYVKVVGGKTPSVSTSPSAPTLQKYLENLLALRGYSNQHYCSLEGGYYCKPTELQKASYGMTLIKAIRTSNENLLRRILKAGLSPNPCNAFGESTIHMVCRRGDYKLLKIFLEHGCSVQVSDDFGRTPLHDACWTTKPCFKSVELLLDRDPRLLHVVDCRGAAPLSYVKQENWDQWMNFLDGKKEEWWPHRDTSVVGEEGPPPLVCRSPHSMPLPDPPHAALCEHARLIASGAVEPEAFIPVGEGGADANDGAATNGEESTSSSNSVQQAAKGATSSGITCRSPIVA